MDGDGCALPIGVAAGIAHSALCCASDGGARFFMMWGWNAQGQLGLGVDHNVASPRRAQFGEVGPQISSQRHERASCIACGGGHSAAVVDGILFTAGSGACGQLGHGQCRDERTFRRVAFDDDEVKWAPWLSWHVARIYLYCHIYASRVFNGLKQCRSAWSWPFHGWQIAAHQPSYRSLTGSNRIALLQSVTGRGHYRRRWYLRVGCSW